VIERIPGLNRRLLVSTGYNRLSRQEAERLVAAGWHSTQSAAWQARAYDQLLKALHAGKPRIDFQVAAEAIKATGLACPSVLEIGCGNGYYGEVLATMLSGGVNYTGLDYSKSMVESASKRYPDLRFQVGDAAALDFPSQSFDIVFNGVSLMHILEFRASIREAARVARSHAIFHCVPVSSDKDHIYLSKYAYGQRVVEIIFSEGRLREIFAECGLELVQTWESLEYDVYRVIGQHTRSLTYLCRAGHG
jgi:ubiquinone/menaquinone biosynthesis C-methylase UbiE